MRKRLLLAGFGALAACGGGDEPPANGPERARARFDATLTYVRTAFEGEGGSLESAFLSDGTDAAGRPGQFVCGIARDRAGVRRAFVTPAFEEGGGTREMLTSLARTRIQKPFWTSGCRTPVRDPAGAEIGFGESPTTTPPAAASAPAPVDPTKAAEPSTPMTGSASGRRSPPQDVRPEPGPLEVPDQPVRDGDHK